MKKNYPLPKQRTQAPRKLDPSLMIWDQGSLTTGQYTNQSVQTFTYAMECEKWVYPWANFLMVKMKIDILCTTLLINLSTVGFIFWGFGQNSKTINFWFSSNQSENGVFGASAEIKFWDQFIVHMSSYWQYLGKINIVTGVWANYWGQLIVYMSSKYKFWKQALHSAFCLLYYLPSSWFIN